MTSWCTFWHLNITSDVVVHFERYEIYFTTHFLISWGTYFLTYFLMLRYRIWRHNIFSLLVDVMTYFLTFWHFLALWYAFFWPDDILYFDIMYDILFDVMAYLLTSSHTFPIIFDVLMHIFEGMIYIFTCHHKLGRHDVKKYVMRSKYVMTSKENTSCHPNVCLDVKKYVMTSTRGLPAW